VTQQLPDSRPFQRHLFFLKTRQSKSFRYQTSK
jgi:hypothetical protein